jgi:hypothetical protein
LLCIKSALFVYPRVAHNIYDINAWFSTTVACEIERLDLVAFGTALVVINVAAVLVSTLAQLLGSLWFCWIPITGYLMVLWFSPKLRPVLMVFAGLLVAANIKVAQNKELGVVPKQSIMSKLMYGRYGVRADSDANDDSQGETAPETSSKKKKKK